MESRRCAELIIKSIWAGVFFSPDSLRSQTRAYSPNVFVEENISRVVVVVQSLEQLDPSDSLY